eukprot:PhM_4_TR10170/c0_g2_i2/m.4190
MKYQQFLSRRALRRTPSPIRAIFPLSQLPPSLAGGLPHPDTFPITGMTLKLSDGSDVSIAPNDLKAALQYCPSYGEVTRKLVTVRTIASLKPIEGADRILCAQVDGWQVVCKTTEFAVGDKCVFFEIDSFLPASDDRFSFLPSPTTHKGVKGYRIRTMKLRGVLSQGLALPLNGFPEIASLDATQLQDRDFSKELNVIKYDPAVMTALKTGSRSVGTYPAEVPRTDQERIQNIWPLVVSNPDVKYEVSMKLDGTSMTVTYLNGEVGVCSRNLKLEIEPTTVYGALMVRSKLIEVLPEIFSGRNMAIQGELMGPKIQGNRELLKDFKFYVFNIYDVDAKKFLAPADRAEAFTAIANACKARGGDNVLSHVPVLHQDVTVSEALAHGGLKDLTLDNVLKFAEGPSLSHKIREGLVYKSMDGKYSFKTISNAFLLKEK